MPAAPANTASAFLKLETNANDLAIVNLAVRLTVDSSGNCADTRIYVGGGIGESYARAVSAEAVLNGAPAEAASFAAASEAVVTTIRTGGRSSRARPRTARTSPKSIRAAAWQRPWNAWADPEKQA